MLTASSLVEAKWFSQDFEVMGTQARVEFEYPAGEDAKLIATKVIEEMHRIDRLMSPYKPKSELSTLNQHAAQRQITISSELFDIIQTSLVYAKTTKGAFDITFSSLGYLYDYREGTLPNIEQTNSLVSSINYKSIVLNAEVNGVSFLDSNTKIDLGGIAKGHAVDQSIRILQRLGIENAFVSAGGDSRVIGRKKDRLWYIGVRHPRDETKLIVNLPLEDIAISTSGDYERFFVKDGIRYHHIIDPNTGRSVKSTQSVTILAENSLDADALSTSVFVLGPKEGLKLINSLEGVSAIIVDANGKMLISSDLTNAN
jgi:thiamine biosynthesis lipoprotein